MGCGGVVGLYDFSDSPEANFPFHLDLTGTWPRACQYLKCFLLSGMWLQFLLILSDFIKFFSDIYRIWGKIMYFNLINYLIKL